jgi:hypothetical protein
MPKGNYQYWRFKFLLPYEYLHDITDGDHYPPEPVIILGRCNIKQFIIAVILLGFSINVNRDILIREGMRLVNPDTEIYPDQDYLDYLFGCPVGTIFGFSDPFDNKSISQHIYENLYGVVSFELEEPKCRK